MNTKKFLVSLNTPFYIAVAGFVGGAILTLVFFQTFGLQKLVNEVEGVTRSEVQNTGAMHHMSDGSMMHGSPMKKDSHMESMMHTMASRMQGKTGDDLDKIFLEDMIMHHQGAVDMAEILARGTQRAELKKMAADIIAVQTKEIEQMKLWQKEWFK